MEIENGIKRNFFLDMKTEGLFYKQVQDVRPILDHCKEARDIQQRNVRTAGWHKVASIPTTLIESWINEGKLTKDLYRDEEQGIRLTQLVKAYAPEYLCSEKNLGIKSISKILT